MSIKVVMALPDFHHKLLYQRITTSGLIAFFFQEDVLVSFSILSLSQVPAWSDKRNYGP